MCPIIHLPGGMHAGFEYYILIIRSIIKPWNIKQHKVFLLEF